MNIAPTFLEQIRNESPYTEAEFRLLQDAVSTGWNIEHRPDGTHKTITASGPISERGRSVPLGQTIPVFFNPANFFGVGAMTWAVTPASTAVFYALIGTRMILDFQINFTTVGGTLSNLLLMTIPDGYWAIRRHVNTIGYCYDNGVAVQGTVYVDAHTNLVRFAREDFANFSASTASTHLQGQIIIEVGTS